MKEKRKEMILKRKNFLPSLVITILLFLALVLLIYFTDPSFQFFLVLFFAIVLLLFLFFFSILFGNTRRGFLVSLVITIFLLLRYLGIGNLLNLFLLISLGVIIEIYANLKK